MVSKSWKNSLTNVRVDLAEVLHAITTGRRSSAQWHRIFLGRHFRGVTAEQHKKIQPKSVTLRTAQAADQRCESTYNRNSAFAHRGGINRGGSRDVSSPLMFSNCADGMKQQPHSHTRFDLFAVLQEAIRENLCRRRRLWCPQALLWGYFLLMNPWPPEILKQHIFDSADVRAKDQRWTDGWSWLKMGTVTQCHSSTQGGYRHTFMWWKQK